MYFVLVICYEYDDVVDDDDDDDDDEAEIDDNHNYDYIDEDDDDEEEEDSKRGKFGRKGCGDKCADRWCSLPNTNYWSAVIIFSIIRN